VNSLTDRIDRNQAELPVSMPWAEFRAEFQSLYAPGLAAPQTAKIIDRILRQVEALGIASTSELTPAFVARYLATRPPGESPYTTRGVLSNLRTVCSYAEQMGYVRINPFRLRRLSRWVGHMPPPGDGKKRHCSRAEIKAVWDLAASDVATRQGWHLWRARRIQAALAIASLMGLRRNELLGLHVADVDLRARIIWIRAHDGRKLKTAASQAALPIPAALMPILESWLQHRLDAPPNYPMPDNCPWMFPSTARKGAWIHGSSTNRAINHLRALARRAGVSDMTWQMLRRSCGTHLEAHGVGRATIKRILRHTTERMSEQFYSEQDIPNLSAAVDGFSY
jgi:integrase